MITWFERRVFWISVTCNNRRIFYFQTTVVTIHKYRVDLQIVQIASSSISPVSGNNFSDHEFKWLITLSNWCISPSETSSGTSENGNIIELCLAVVKFNYSQSLSEKILLPSGTWDWFLPIKKSIELDSKLGSFNTVLVAVISDSGANRNTNISQLSIMSDQNYN